MAAVGLAVGVTRDTVGLGAAPLAAAAAVALPGREVPDAGLCDWITCWSGFALWVDYFN